MAVDDAVRKNGELDLRLIARSLGRHAGAIALGVLLVAGATYVLSVRQPPTYQANGSVVAFDTGGDVRLQTSLAAPPFPQGAVEEAMHSKNIVGRIIRKLQASDLDPRLVGQLAQSLNSELAENMFSRIRVRSRLNPQQLGTYVISARAETPEAARFLAEASMNALLEWDTDRAQQGVRRAQTNLQKQLQALNLRIGTTAAQSLARQSLIAARGQVMQDLAQLAVLESAASGALSALSEPVTPSRPVAPRPVFNTILAALLALLFSSALVLLIDALRRRATAAEDLLPFGLPVLGQLPRLPGKELREGFLAATRSGPLYESVGFLRLNLLPLLEARPHKRLVVSSAHPGEGSSSVTAALARSFAASGQHVLIMDANVHQPGQLRLWAPSSITPHLLPGSRAEEVPVLNLADALEQPQAAHAIQVSRNIDLIPAGNGLRGGMRKDALHSPAFGELLATWSQGYDVVLIDAPSMLGLADALTIAQHTDGLLLVVEAGRTQLSDVRRSLQSARNAGVNVLGTVLNKQRMAGGLTYDPLEQYALR